MPLELLWFLSLLSVHVELVIGQISFITTPVNVSADELETVTLTCSVNHTSIYYRYHWSKNGVEISQQANMYTDLSSELGIDIQRYSVSAIWNQMDDGQVKFDNDLRIVNVQHNYSAPDSGVYAYYMNDITNGKPGIEILRSDDVYLVVRKDPPITDPECTNVPTTVVREGEEVSLECTSEKGNPDITLKWSVKGDTDWVLNTMLSRSVSTLNLSYFWSPHYTEQGIIFTCTARRSSPYNLDRSCEVGPFDIQYQPKVILQQVDNGQGSESELRSFTCSWLANPKAPNIVWYFDNYMINSSQGRYVIDIWHDYSTLVVQNVSNADHNMSVECEVMNQIGITKASTVLVIASTAYQTTSSTPTESASDVHHQNSVWPSSDIRPTNVYYTTSPLALRSHQPTYNNTAVTIMGVLLGLFSVVIGILTFFLCIACRRIRNMTTEQQGKRSQSADYVISDVKVPNTDPASGKDSKHDNDMKDADIYDKIKETSIDGKEVPDIVDKEGYAELIHHHGDSGQGQNTHLYTSLTNKL